MSSLSISNSRKRHHFPEFRDDSDSEELPPKRRCRNESGFTFLSFLVLPVVLKTKLQKISDWLRDGSLQVNTFVTMALTCGAREKNLPPNQLQDDSVEEEEEDDDIEEIDDDDIQEIKENVNEEILSPLVKQFGCLSSDPMHSKQQLAVNGSYSSGPFSKPLKSNGARELSTRYHGTTDCSLRRDYTDSLKRKPLISNPATEVKVLLGAESKVIDGIGSEPEVITVDGDGVEIVSELPSSIDKHTTSQKSFHSSVKSSSKISATALMQTPSKRLCSTPKSYTANEVVRLQEKAQYRLLLDKYINGSVYQYVHKKPRAEVEEKKDDKSMFSLRHFKKEVLEQPISSFIQKYYKPCQLLPPISKEASKKEENPPEITIVDDGEVEVEVIDMKLPKHKAEFKETLFTDDWLTELKRHVKKQAEERNDIVIAHEKQLEELKRKRLLRELKVGDVIKKTEPEFPELTPDMEVMIDDVLNTGSPEDRITKIGLNELLRKDFDTLTGLKWLNDEIINAYFEMIIERSKSPGYPSAYAFSTFFYTNLKTRGYHGVKRWTRKIDIFNYDLIFVPVHLTIHWCLGVIDNRVKKVYYYDSMGQSEEVCLAILHDYLMQEYQDKKKSDLDPTLYVTEIKKDIPQQQNGSDCGMFTIKYAEYIARDAEITFDQTQMRYFRRRTVYELLTNSLFPHK